MRTHTHESLSEHTTLRLGGATPKLLDFDAEDELVQAIRDADASKTPFVVLGGGSNVVVADSGLPFPVFRPRFRGLSVHETGGEVLVQVAAGHVWDDVVADLADKGLVGLECLSGIPGFAGAAPIQNIGAYGQELASSLVAVRAYDRERREIVDLPKARCRLAYRTSLFKAHADEQRYVVLGLELRLRRAPPERPRYADLSQLLGPSSATPSVSRIREAVLVLRRAKGMVSDPCDPDSRSAGSFFVNPVVTRARADQIERLASAHPGVARARPMPRFEQPDGHVKLAAAWLVEQAGFAKGYSHGRAGISRKHALAIVNRGGASALEVLDLARRIQEAVEARFGVQLAPEPVFLGFSEQAGPICGRLP